jgi:HAD superfamily hydrolase (TIGR01509 family)
METERKPQKSRRKIWLDIWRTMAFCNHPLVNREPVIRAQQLVGLRCTQDRPQPPLSDDFLHWSLTTHITSPAEFVACAEQRFGCTRTDDCEAHFADLLDAEKEGTELYPDVIPSLAAMEAMGVDMGILSNLWHFPANRIMVDLELGQFFQSEDCIFSYQVGLRKPDQRIFHEACRRSGRKPADNVMVDDNMDVIVGAARVGMHTVLMDREGKYSPLDVAHIPNCTYVTNMAQLIRLIESE